VSHRIRRHLQLHHRERLNKNLYMKDSMKIVSTPFEGEKNKHVHETKGKIAKANAWEVLEGVREKRRELRRRQRLWPLYTKSG